MRKDNALIIPALNAGPSIFFMLNMSDKELEEGSTLRLDFKKLRKIASGQEDVIPAIAQDAQTGEVLILGYVNELALKTRKLAKELVEYIDVMKVMAIQETDKLEKAVADTITLHYVSSKDNYDVPAQVLLGDEMSNNGRGKSEKTYPNSRPTLQRV